MVWDVSDKPSTASCSWRCIWSWSPTAAQHQVRVLLAWVLGSALPWQPGCKVKLWEVSHAMHALAT